LFLVWEATEAASWNQPIVIYFSHLNQYSMKREKGETA
jgi:hypothetical protein